MQIRANGIWLEVEAHGPPDGIPLILIRGLGTQLVQWPQAFVQGFAALGYRTIIFDNRDSGLSQRCPAEGVPGAADQIVAMVNDGNIPDPAYSVSDMAKDVIGLMDALEIETTHVLGISMGGLIAQILAKNHADRLLSDTIVMTSAGLRNPAILPMILARAQTRTEAQDALVEEFRNWGSPGYPMPEAEIREQAGRNWDRAHDPEGVNRQALATISAPDRREDLKSIDLPCLVIHGADDTLIPPAEGRDIAALIPDAELRIVEGMGHIITPLLAPVIVDMVHDFIQRRGA